MRGASCMPLSRLQPRSWCVCAPETNSLRSIEAENDDTCQAFSEHYTGLQENIIAMTAPSQASSLLSEAISGDGTRKGGCYFEKFNCKSWIWKQSTCFGTNNMHDMWRNCKEKDFVAVLRGVLTADDDHSDARAELADLVGKGVEVVRAGGPVAGKATHAV